MSPPFTAGLVCLRGSKPIAAGPHEAFAGAGGRLESEAVVAWLVQAGVLPADGKGSLPQPAAEQQDSEVGRFSSRACVLTLPTRQACHLRGLMLPKSKPAPAQRHDKLSGCRTARQRTGTSRARCAGGATSTSMCRRLRPLLSQMAATRTAISDWVKLIYRGCFQKFSVVLDFGGHFDPVLICQPAVYVLSKPQRRCKPSMYTKATRPRQQTPHAYCEAACISLGFRVSGLPKLQHALVGVCGQLVAVRVVRQPDGAHLHGKTTPFIHESMQMSVRITTWSLHAEYVKTLSVQGFVQAYLCDGHQVLQLAGGHAEAVQRVVLAQAVQPLAARRQRRGDKVATLPLACGTGTPGGCSLRGRQGSKVPTAN